ncbi:unnamed protein product [Cylicocyclus nassatus]|uniref:Uncharacterized protein n=1 Tax=Cylicocyclus nassatus TaxID=53992 RepID=A0AA36HBI3_CYLNA|nr:unnamed protein product [Cylicocyclus nassatus]
MFGALALLASNALAFGCSPLPAGQEVRVSFLADGLMKIPLEFAYSETKAVTDKQPKFATNKDDAMKNIRQYIKRAVTSVIRQEARKAGIEHLVTNIASQIKPTVYGSPLKCSSLIEGTTSIPSAEENATPKPLALFCVVKDDLVTNIAYTAPKKEGDNTELPEFYEVPPAHQQFTVTLAVSNSIIAGWSRDKWDLMLLQVEKQLRSDTNASSSSVRVCFLVDGLLILPLEFAYTEYGEVLANKPKFATNKDEALKNIRNYIKKAVIFAIRREAIKDGIEKNITHIASQIKPTVYGYPLKCSSLIEGQESIPRESNC